LTRGYIFSNITTGRTNCTGDDTMQATMIVIDIKCPVCKKTVTPEQLKEISNTACGQDDMTGGYAIITPCCSAIVAKDSGFDKPEHFGLSSWSCDEIEKIMKKNGWKRVNDIILTNTPQIWRKRKVTQKRPKPEYIEEIILLEKK
jgi:hypothetical protein